MTFVEELMFRGAPLAEVLRLLVLLRWAPRPAWGAVRAAPRDCGGLSLWGVSNRVHDCSEDC